MKKEPHSGQLLLFYSFLPRKMTLLSSLRVVRGLLVNLVKVEQKGHVGAWGLQGPKERKATLDWKDRLAPKETRWVL